MRIVDVREITQPISSPIRNAYIDFTKMTTSLVAIVTAETIRMSGVLAPARAIGVKLAG